MSFNQIENAFLATAIDNLKPQWEKHYGPFNGRRFYLGSGIDFMAIRDGPDAGKLTIAQKTLDHKVAPDPKITPVDCYNLMRPGEDLATAVARVYHGISTPYSTFADYKGSNGSSP